MNNKELSQTICLLPVSSISIHATGKIVRCQMSETAMGDIANGAIIDQWNNDDFQTLRRNQKQGIWTKGCDNCRIKEENNIVSKRQHWKTLEIFDDVWDKVDWTSDMANEIYHLDIAFNNICNFKCKMCNSAYSNAWINDEHKLQEMGFPGGASGADIRTSSTFNRQKWSLSTQQLEQIVDHSKNLRRVEVLGGEPFLVPEFMQFLDLLEKHGLSKQIELMVTTNGSVVTEQHLSKLEGFKYVNINLSLDGTGNYFPYMRSAGVIDWAGIVDKAVMIKNWCDQPRSGKYKLNINGTYQAINALNIKDFIEFIIKFYQWDQKPPSPASKHRHSFEHRILVGPKVFQSQWLPREILEQSLTQVNDLLQTYDFLSTITEKRYIFDIKKLIENTLNQPPDRQQQIKYQTELVKLLAALEKIRQEDFSTVAPEIFRSYQHYFNEYRK